MSNIPKDKLVFSAVPAVVRRVGDYQNTVPLREPTECLRTLAGSAVIKFPLPRLPCVKGGGTA